MNLVKITHDEKLEVMSDSKISFPHQYTIYKANYFKFIKLGQVICLYCVNDYH